MSNSINLLADKKTNKQLSIVFTKLGMMRFIAVSLLFGISAASIILFTLIAISPLPTLQNQEKNASFTLEQQQQDIAKLVLINERADNITKLLAQRQSFDSSIDRVRSKMPAGISVTSFTVARDNISLTVSSKSLALLDQFLNKLVQATDEKKDFSRVTLADLSIDNDTFLMKVNLVTL